MPPLEERQTDLEREGDDGQQDAQRGQRALEALLTSALGHREREPAQEPADEAAGVGEVVHAGHEESEDEQDERPLPVLSQDEPTEDAAPLASVRDHGAQQSKDGARGADRERNP